MLWLAPNNMQTIFLFSKTQWNVCACGIGYACIHLCCLLSECKTKVWKVQLQTLMNLTSFKLFLVRSNSHGRGPWQCSTGMWQGSQLGVLLLRRTAFISQVCLPRMHRSLVTRLGASVTVSHQPFNNENVQWVKGAINWPHQIRWLQRHDHLKEE